jgi:Erv1 / Alr family
MSPSTWGPPTWIFMHTMAEKIKEESFPIIGQHLILLFIQISYHLPCPECSQHSKEFWSKVKPGNIKNKTDLINLLFVFHNIVNKRKRQLPFKYVDLQYYKTRNVIETFNKFAQNFNTKGNMNLINESFHRKLMMTSLRTWVMTHLVHFNL